MTTLIEQNNEKRKQLNAKNEKIYVDMLVYVRLSFNKSEEETEEVLMELLDHLLILQSAGKDASELFGNDPKGYANELIGELPKAIPKEMVTMLFLGIFYFLGVVTFLNGMIGTIAYYGFGKMEAEKVFHLGTVAVLTVSSLVIAFGVMYVAFSYLKWSCFRKVSKVFEFMVSSLLVGVIPFAIFITLFYFMPSFGPSIILDVYWLMIIGIIFYFLGRYLKNK